MHLERPKALLLNRLCSASLVAGGDWGVREIDTLTMWQVSSGFTAGVNCWQTTRALEVVHRISTGARRDPVLARGHLCIPSGDRLLVINPTSGEVAVELPGPGAPFSVLLVNENTLLVNAIGSSTLSTPNGPVDIVGVAYLLDDLQSGLG